jgi:hypothetical protein
LGSLNVSDEPVSGLETRLLMLVFRYSSIQQQTRFCVRFVCVVEARSCRKRDGRAAEDLSSGQSGIPLLLILHGDTDAENDVYVASDHQTEGDE